MKREREGDVREAGTATGDGGTGSYGGAHPAATTTATHRKQRLVSGGSVGLPRHPVVLVEEVMVEELHTVLVRIPCFDFFRHVRLCERTGAPQPVEVEEAVGGVSPPTLPGSGGQHSRAGSAFAPDAAVFERGTLETDTPRLVLNGGTPNEMHFEGRWCEVAGDGVPIANRAILHLCLDTTVAPATSSEVRPSSATRLGGDALSTQEPPEANTTSTAAPPSSTTLSTPPIASLLTHTAVGVTADEERHRRAEQQKGWTYDRIDVPSAVLVMHRVR
ncbi:hypothetical protein NESM_000765600 [Novymonas esmeraldas]|uniref:Uncharacterized protein n=1 Tax=Novymonas esmeraldas TaxID=1808958 RepID=A0AAW0EXB1_9TRYP